jgi:hypothetical protein
MAHRLVGEQRRRRRKIEGAAPPGKEQGVSQSTRVVFLTSSVHTGGVVDLHDLQLQVRELRQLHTCKPSGVRWKKGRRGKGGGGGVLQLVVESFVKHYISWVNIPSCAGLWSAEGQVDAGKPLGKYANLWSCSPCTTIVFSPSLVGACYLGDWSRMLWAEVYLNTSGNFYCSRWHRFRPTLQVKVSGHD